MVKSEPVYTFPIGEALCVGDMSEEKLTRVLLVDDHPLVRAGLRQVLDHELDFEVFAEADNAADALTAAQAGRCDVALVDINIRGRSGIELIKEIRAHGLTLPVVVISFHDEVTYAERAIRAGAQGYILKREPIPEIIKGMRRVLAGEMYVSEPIASRLMSRMGAASVVDADEERPQLTKLSDRELEVYEKIGHGLTTREIAEELRVSVSTVETHRANIRGKLGYRTAAEMATGAATWRLKTECG